MNSISRVQFFIVAWFFICPNLWADQMIGFFLRPYPDIRPEKPLEKVVNALARPGKIARTRAKNIVWDKSMMSGIMATYGGYITVSDLNSYIGFPRKHTKPLVYLIITPKLTPIVRSANTLSHWELVENAPAHMFKVEKIQDQKNNIPYFKITAEQPPTNSIIPLESIVLFADPAQVVVPLGITISPESPHLLLPDIYIRKGISLVENALYMLNLLHYYGIIAHLYRKEAKRYSTQLTY